MLLGSFFQSSEMGEHRYHRYHVTLQIGSDKSLGAGGADVRPSPILEGPIPARLCALLLDLRPICPTLFPGPRWPPLTHPRSYRLLSARLRRLVSPQPSWLTRDQRQAPWHTSVGLAGRTDDLPARAMLGLTRRAVGRLAARAATPVCRTELARHWVLAGGASSGESVGGDVGGGGPTSEGGGLILGRKQPRRSRPRESGRAYDISSTSRHACVCVCFPPSQCWLKPFWLKDHPRVAP